MKIKQSIIFSFLMWMKIGKHGLSSTKSHMAMRKGEKIAKIFYSDDDYLEMNEYCQERYLIFLKQYLNNGKSFIESLQLNGAMEIMQIRKRISREMMR